MKVLNEKFTDDEFEAMRYEKDKTRLSWHDYLLEVIINKRGE